MNAYRTQNGSQFHLPSEQFVDHDQALCGLRISNPAADIVHGDTLADLRQEAYDDSHGHRFLCDECQQIATEDRT
jgi:hypothetical protein